MVVSGLFVFVTKGSFVNGVPVIEGRESRVLWQQCINIKIMTWGSGEERIIMDF